MSREDFANNFDSLDLARVEEMCGTTLTSVSIGRWRNEDAVLFLLPDGTGWVMTYEPDCCASCEILDIAGDLQDLVGAPLAMAEESSNREADNDGSQTWTYYKLATTRGYVTISWYGSSNGYYSEEACLRRVEPKDGP